MFVYEITMKSECIPSEFSMMRGVLPSMTATAELVVPRSIPMTEPLTFSSAYPRAKAGARKAGVQRAAEAARGRSCDAVSVLSGCMGDKDLLTVLDNLEDSIVNVCRRRCWGRCKRREDLMWCKMNGWDGRMEYMMQRRRSFDGDEKSREKLLARFSTKSPLRDLGRQCSRNRKEQLT
jgi:hypothetical protein